MSVDVAFELAALRSDGVNLDLGQLLAYQRMTYLLDLDPKQQIQSKLAGSYLARSKGRGMEFDEVRHYQIGDDVRTIDWRVTARTGKVHTKLFREEKERPVFVLADLSQSMQFGSVLLTKAVQTAHLAALLGWHARERGDKFGGIVFNNQQIRELKPASRHVSVLRYLQQMIELNRQAAGNAINSQVTSQPLPATPPASSLSLACGQLRRLVRPGSLVYLISDFSTLDQTVLRHLQSMQQHNEIRLCRVLDPLDQMLPAQAYGQLLLTDGQQQLPLTLGSRQLAEHYQQQQQQVLDSQTQLMRKLGLPLMQLSCAQSLRTQLSGTTGNPLQRSPATGVNHDSI